MDKHLVTDQVVLTIGYDIENLTDEARRKKYHGEVYTDYYGRVIPKPAHGTGNIDGFTSSTKRIMKTMMELYDRIVDPNLLVRRITIVANHTIPEGSEKAKNRYEQMDLFQDFLVEEKPEEKEQKMDPEMESDKERRVQNAILEIQKRYGKNALLKGMNLEEGAMTRERNNQIGGHKA